MDWTVVAINFFASVPPTLVALAALVAAFRAGKKVDAIHTDVNSRMSELVAASVAEARAVGELRGRDAERERSD